MIENAGFDRKIKFVGDRHHATYRHEIYLKNGIVLDGYSKHRTHSEPKDKERTLVGVVGRLISGGYLEKSQYIAFYLNNGIGKENDPLLIELKASKYTLHNEAQHMFQLATYLANVYDAKKNGKQPQEVVRPKAARQFPSSWFAIKGQFKRKDELIAYCSDLKAKGVPSGRVEGYYEAYLETFPELNGKAVNHKAIKLINDLANQKTIQ